MDVPKTRFMVVEDHAFQRSVLVSMLRDLGAREVLEAPGGRQALEHLRRAGASPEVLVCDLDMPDMDGIELLQEIAALGLTPAILVVSGRDPEIAGSVSAMLKATGLELLGSLPKPVTREQLRRALDRNTRGRRQSGPSPGPLGEPQLRAALDEGAFKAAFQPKVLVRTRGVLSMEALARLQTAAGAVSPAEFIPALQRHGLLGDLMFAMLRQSCEALNFLDAKGLPLAVCVNISMSTLGEPGILDRIAAFVRDHGIAPERVTFEVTETEVMAKAGQVLATLARLRLKGFGIAIDDFGTGYASLQHLDDIPFTELKIDQSFVQRCTSSPRTANIVRSTIGLAHALGRTAIAEGVEDATTWSFLDEMRCDSIQGYFVARPMPGADLPAWAAGWAARAADRRSADGSRP